MWIRGRFFATSKRGSHRLIWLVCVVVAQLLMGCVVTDKITFDEADNNPIALLAAAPEKHIKAVTGEDAVNFTVTVWDPDVLSPDDQQIGALLTYSTDYWETQEDICRTPPVPLSEEENVYGVDGTVFNITCLLDLTSLELIDNSLLSVTMTVSDLGFQSHSNKPRKGAQLVSHNWGLQIVPER